ncbi:gluconokinase [Pyxidicoccus fallax]|uniref:Gluconokinase n=1 Tax=Pyxidicoccus fallax TaxID=394095 RepID=A0A848LAE2_9BACT|nr:gluconokinase [Pyxidicoccus fallax]NMO16030.1 gluconokinase [Pyxidicoccus fallax]NPC76957.1 gluconokinase [Pyxidicoccus fallax]
MVVIVMGVSGAGKTTVGSSLAEALGWRFLDADDLHPVPNKVKMAQGVPLTDEDRWPWLWMLSGVIGEALRQGDGLVVACSALKEAYRKVLEVDAARVRFVYLDASRELLASRLSQRHGHFMPPSLLDSQLATLEVPDSALRVDVTPPVKEVVARIREGLGL